MFTKTSDAGQVEVELYRTSPIQSCGECSTICLTDRASPWECGAFNCRLSDMSCDFYALWTTQAAPLHNIDLFLFQATDKFHHITINGHPYSIYLSSTKKDHRDAVTHCQTMDSHLYYFDSLDDYEAIRMVAAGQGMDFSYVGANDEKDEGRFVSDKDGTAIDTRVWLWGDGEPQDGGFIGKEDCMIIHYTDGYELHDVSCWRAETFLCKREV